MPTPNYSQAYRNYMTNSAGYALPSSVRTYSVFDPSSNSWKRMSSDISSPLPSNPAQGQQSVADALAQARQTQGTAYPAQGMTPTQTPGVFLRPRDQGQVPSQVPAGGSGMPSPVPIQETPIMRASARGNVNRQQESAYVDPYASHANEDPRAPLTQPSINVPVQLKAVPENAVAFNGMGKTPEGVQFTTSNAETYVPPKTETSVNTNGWVTLANDAKKYANPAIQGINALANLPAAIGGVAGRALGQYAAPVATTALGFLNPSFGFSALGNHLVNTRRK